MPRITGKKPEAPTSATATAPVAPPAKKNGNGNKPAVQKPTNGKAKPKKEKVYPHVQVKLFLTDKDRLPPGHKPEGMTVKVMKEILGWQDEEDYAAQLKKELPAAEFKQRKIEFGDDYLFLDRYGKKVRLMNNLKNRPFDPRTAEDWMLEILRMKWEFNGESMIVDEYGNTQDIQHRGVGLIWAGQEWEKDRILPDPDRQWLDWESKPQIDCLVVLGIDSRDKVVNTINTGKPRTFADALYRSVVYQEAPPEERARLSKITSGAVTFLWKRSDAALHSLAPRRPHSESFDFLEAHPKILECVKFVLSEGDGKKLTPYLSLGYASALLYMMGSAASDVAEYASEGCHEKALDWELWDKAQEFWVLFCSNAAALEPLHEELNSLPEWAKSIEFSVALFIKAWNLWSNKKKVTQEAITLEMKDTADSQELAECPRIGGIDVDREEEQETPPEAKDEEEAHAIAVDEAAKGERGICPKLTDKNKKPTEHEWITEDTATGKETFCAHCKEPFPKAAAPKKGGKKK